MIIDERQAEIDRAVMLMSTDICKTVQERITRLGLTNREGASLALSAAATVLGVAAQLLMVGTDKTFGEANDYALALLHRSMEDVCDGGDDPISRMTAADMQERSAQFSKIVDEKKLPHATEIYIDGEPHDAHSEKVYSGQRAAQITHVAFGDNVVLIQSTELDEYCLPNGDLFLPISDGVGITVPDWRQTVRAVIQ